MSSSDPRNGVVVTITTDFTQHEQHVRHEVVARYKERGKGEYELDSLRLPTIEVHGSCVPGLIEALRGLPRSISVVLNDSVEDDGSRE